MFHRDDPFNRDGQLRAQSLRDAQRAAAAASNPSLADMHGYASPLGQIMAPSSGGLLSGAKVYLAADFPVVGSDPVVEGWELGTLGFDTAGYFSASADDRFTAREAGYYLVGANVLWEAAFTPTNWNKLHLYVNGVSVVGNRVAPDADAQQVVTVLHRLAAGDYVQVRANADDAAASVLEGDPPAGSHFWIARLF
jgi:hypothetical protein